MFDRSRYEPKTIIVDSLRAMNRAFDADALSPSSAIELVDWYAAVERLAAAGKTLAAGAAVRGEPWRATGDRSAADWLAKRTGTTVGDARSVLDVSANLPSAPATDTAFRDGELSPKQAEAVAAAAAADASSEERLLDMARHQSLQKLRDEAPACGPPPTLTRRRGTSASAATGSGSDGPTPTAPAAAATP